MKIKFNYKKNLFLKILFLVIIFSLSYFGFNNLNIDITDSSVTIENTSNINNTSETSGKFYKVDRVIDGDTIDVIINNEKKRVRLLGIDTPESVDPRREVECFGIEASNALKNLLNGQKVRLEKDNSQSNIGKYNRLLRYVYLDNGIFVNKWLLENGYADRYYGKPDCKYVDEFRKVLKDAKDNEIGMWKECNKKYDK